jgi:hypothetical protein
MPRTTNTRDAGLPAHDLTISFRIPHRHGAADFGAEHLRELVLGKVPIHDLAQLNAHWYESLFVALSVNQKNEVIQVHVLARQTQHLAYPQAGIQSDEVDDACPSLNQPKRPMPWGRR